MVFRVTGARQVIVHGTPPQIRMAGRTLGVVRCDTPEEAEAVAAVTWPGWYRSIRQIEPAAEAVA